MKYDIRHLKESHNQLICVVCLFISKWEKNKKVSKSYVRQVKNILKIADKIADDYASGN